MLRPLRVLAAALLLVIATGALAACGSSKDESPAQLLSDTFGPNHPIRSGKLDLSLALEVKGLASLKDPLALKLSGPFQSVGKGKLPKFDFTAAINTGGTNISAGAVSTGDKGFLRLAGDSYVLSDAIFKQFKDGYESASKDDKGKNTGVSFKSLGIDPQRWLKDPKSAGSEQVGGADTLHITAGIDVGRLLTDISTLLGKAGNLGQGAVPTSLTAQQRKDIESSVKSTTLDLWTGKKDKTLRRIKLHIDIAVPADVQKRAGGLQSGKLDFNLLIADLNSDQTITAPASPKPLSALTDALGQLTGTGSSGSSGGTATTPATTTPATTTPATGSSSSSAYLDCLQSAGSDVAAVQKCASKLGQ